MMRVNVHEAKTHLSRYLKKARNGETIIICNRNVPIAEIRGIRPRLGKKRPLGSYKGQFEVGPEFFEPLPDEILKAFNSQD